MAIVNINSGNFEEEVLKSDKPVLVDFFATWCGPCKVVGPVVEELSNEYDDIKFCKLDIDESRDFAVENGIMSVPTMILYSGGKEINKSIGSKGKEDLKKFIGK